MAINFGYRSDVDGEIPLARLDATDAMVGGFRSMLESMIELCDAVRGDSEVARTAAIQALLVVAAEAACADDYSDENGGEPQMARADFVKMAGALWDYQLSDDDAPAEA